MQFEKSFSGSYLANPLQSGDGSMIAIDDQPSRVVIEEGDYEDATNLFDEFGHEDDEDEEEVIQTFKTMSGSKLPDLNRS